MALTNQRNTLLVYGVWIASWLTLFMAGPQDHYLFVIFLAVTYVLFLGDRLHILNRDHFVEVAGVLVVVSTAAGMFMSTGFVMASGLLIGALILLRKD